MAHKRLSTKEIKTDPVSASALRAQAKGLQTLNGYPRVSLGNFIGIEQGKIRKRSFWFSMFAILAFVYVVLCMTPLVPFNSGLGTFIFGCNAAFGLNYYKNERDKVGANGVQ